MLNLKLEMFGPREDSPDNMATWSREITMEEGSSVLDVVKNITVYENNVNLRFIIDRIVNHKDLTAGVFVFNGKRVINYEELCSTIVEQGNTVSIFPQLIAG